MTIFFHNNPYLFMFFLFASGAITGSFLHLCIVRIPRNQSIIFPASHCPSCKTPIPFYHKIPIVSYLVLQGRCNSCGKVISILYPMVEIITGCMALVFALRFGINCEALIYFLFFCVLFVVSCIDLNHLIIPDKIAIPGTIIFFLAEIFIVDKNLFFVSGGIAAGSGSLLAVSLGYYLIRKQAGIGGGDIKLMAMIGTVTGAEGAFFTIFAASVSGAMAGIFIMISHMMRPKKLIMRQHIPFGPFLSVSALIYLFYGKQIINWYFNSYT